MSVNSKMTALADEIRELSGTTTPKSLDSMTYDVNVANTEIAEQAELLNQIVTALEGKASGSGGVVLPTLSNPAAASDILSGKEAIDGSGNKITGTIATKTSSNLTVSGATVSVPAGYYASNASKSVTTITQATPTVSIDENGKISASATQTAGYVSAGTKTGTKQMTTKAATTYTPSTSNQTIASGTYLTGTQTIVGDANLIAENIKSGTSIFGVTGSYEGGNVSGEGATIETYTGTLSASGMMPPLSPYGTLWYTDASLTIQNVEISSFPHSFTVVKNSIIYWKDQADVSFKNGTNATKIYSTHAGATNSHAAIVPTADNFEIKLGM